MLSFFPRGVLDEILNLIESVSEEFPSYSCQQAILFFYFFSGTMVFEATNQVSRLSLDWLYRKKNKGSYNIWVKGPSWPCGHL